MFFDEDDIFDEEESYFNPEIYRLVSREYYSNLDALPYALRSVPTHTEDGIPIRKLYVANLPPKTTRLELFGVFAQYGFIKSCWLRMGDKGFYRGPAPAYAFITFSNPEDAHKALEAPSHEKILRGRNLRISPADSWHQPLEDAEGKVIWKKKDRKNNNNNNNNNREQNGGALPVSTSENGETSNIEVIVNEEQSTEVEPCYNILDILNTDCLNHILTFVPIRDIIRSERVSKRWQSMVQEYIESIRLFKTSWWQQQPRLTTAVLRRVLSRVGPALTRLHIDHPWSALNDRTAHTVGKFCPNLEELKIVSMHTKNWNPLIYGCKKLKSLIFLNCTKLTDSSLVHLVKDNSSIESLTVANNTHVTGLFLTGSSPLKLSSLAFYNCYSLQGTVLTTAIDTLPNLTTLKLDVCPVAMWKIIPLILKKLPKLEVLSLSEYSSVELCVWPHVNEAFCESLGNLKELKSINLSRNIYISNAVLKAIGQHCGKLESLNVSSCNSRKSFPHPGVGDEGILAICKGCTTLRSVDVSYLSHLTATGVRGLAQLPQLSTLTARALTAVTAPVIAHCLQHCHQLEMVDICGCDNVTEQVISSAAEILNARPRQLLLRVVGTAVPMLEEHPTHSLLTVDMYVDTCNPNFRPDFEDEILDSSDESYTDDVHEDDYHYIDPADDIFLHDEDEEDLEEYLYELHYY